MQYPAEGLYRGMTTNEAFIDVSDQFISASSFRFKPNPDRKDDSEECSVNWIDDDGAILSIAHQVTEDKKTHELRHQFTAGACRLPLDCLESVRKTYPSCFSYERAPKTEVDRYGNDPNPYHGNLLFLSPAQPGAKRKRNQIISVLAFMAQQTPNSFVSRNELDRLIKRSN